MAAKTIIDIKHDDRGTITYDRMSKDFTVLAPTGEFLGYATSGQQAAEMLNAWHYDNAKAAA